MCADRSAGIIYDVADAELFRRDGGEEALSAVLLERYRGGERAARRFARRVGEAGFVYRLREGKGAAVHYRHFAALEDYFDGFELHARYRREHVLAGPYGDAVRKREAGKPLVLFDYRLDDVGELARFVSEPDAGPLRRHEADRRLLSGMEADARYFYFVFKRFHLRASFRAPPCACRAPSRSRPSPEAGGPPPGA